MHVVSIKDALPGMVVARTLYAPNGSVLLSAGLELTSLYIRRLQDLGVIALYIQDDNTPEVEIEDVVSDKTRVDAIRLTREVMKEIKVSSTFDMAQVFHAVNSIIDELIRNRNILINLVDIRSKNEYLFGHSVNVTVLSVMIGIALEYNQLKLKDLAAGALLHDVGKSLIDERIVKKSGALTEKERKLMKEHTVLGFEILRKIRTMSLLSAHVALQHHEAIDGSGYPRGLSDRDITDFARIVSVANAYDKMTTDRVGHRRMQPFHAFEVLCSKKGTLYDPDIVDHLSRIVAIFPIGTELMLNTGEKAVVIRTHKDASTKPTVKILEDPMGEKVSQKIEVDLKIQPEYFVMEVLDQR